jgi:hypothetical protein
MKRIGRRVADLILMHYLRGTTDREHLKAHVGQLAGDLQEPKTIPFDEQQVAKKDTDPAKVERRW